jgi:hypothetical protein
MASNVSVKVIDGNAMSSFFARAIMQITTMHKDNSEGNYEAAIRAIAEITTRIGCNDEIEAEMKKMITDNLPPPCGHCDTCKSNAKKRKTKRK